MLRSARHLLPICCREDGKSKEPTEAQKTLAAQTESTLQPSEIRRSKAKNDDLDPKLIDEVAKLLIHEPWYHGKSAAQSAGFLNETLLGLMPREEIGN